MKILVTGATGLLGSDLVKTLGSDFELYGWSRHSPKQPVAGVRYASVDLTDRQAVRERFEGIAPKLVIHTAAISDVDVCESNSSEAEKLHVEATETLASMCNRHRAFLIAVSTDYVFDGTLGRPYREEDDTCPVSVYGRSKRKAEQAVLKLGSQSLVIRVSGLFGLGRPNFVGCAAADLRAGQAVSVVSDQVNSPSYTVDLCEGFLRLAREIEGLRRDREGGAPGARGPELTGVLHLANSGGASRLEVVRQLAHLLQAPESLIRPTTWAALNRPARRPPDSRLDCSRWSRWAGERLRSWQEALVAFLPTLPLVDWQPHS